MDNHAIFKGLGAFQGHQKWLQMVKRAGQLEKREPDIRSDFARDYTRILHSSAYRRLKHKTQVFYTTQNDHICTRIEHVNHVESVSYTIASYFGLNTELTKAIAAGHDLGHTPFGHLGETIMRQLFEQELSESFWHERNGLHFVDDIELLENEEGAKTNLCLTYAVRDGIISHCGEVDESGIKPREQAIDLDHYQKSNAYPPYTWEGCIVKISDRIAYLGRDIEDALTLNILNKSQLEELEDIIKNDRILPDPSYDNINNTMIMHNLIIDLCKHSNPEDGINLSPPYFNFINEVKKFNYRNIYEHQRLKYYQDYATLIINSIYKLFKNTYQGEETLEELNKLNSYYPELGQTFIKWISSYWDLTDRTNKTYKLANKVIYRVKENESDYRRAILDFISGMTDQYAIKTFNQITSF